MRNFIWQISLAITIGIAVAGHFAVQSSQNPPQQPPPAQASTASIAGVVVDDRNAPIANVSVAISSDKFAASALTNAEGKFEFKNLQPAKYIISAQAARFRKGQTAVIITKPDEVLQNISLKLVPSSLHVAVYDANNQALGGVVISLYSQAGTAAEASAAQAVTDRFGDAYFGRLAPGSYKLTAVARGYEEYRNEVFISTDITTDFSIQLLVAPIIPINEKAVIRYTVPNLPSRTIRTLFQDSDGWMWFGTDKGIARFNGVEFKSSAGADSLYAPFAGEDVRAIAEDRKGRIWIGTSHNVKRITKEGVSDGQEIEGVETRHLFVDSRGVVWIATAVGVFKFNGEQLESFDEARGLPSNDARTIAEDKTGKIWIATAKGVATITNDKIVTFEPPRAAPSEQAFTPANRQTKPNPSATASPANQVRQSAAAPANLDFNDVQALLVDRSNILWFATSKGAFSFHPDDQYVDTWQQVTDLPVRAITQDSAGRMWLALQNSGALIHDVAGRQSERFTSLEKNQVLSIFNGREGNLWFATDNGVVFADTYSFVNFTTSRGLPDNDARKIITSPDGALWCVTASGVSRLQDERFAPLPQLRSVNNLRDVAFDKTGAAWFATTQGAVKLSGQTLTQFGEGKGLVSSNIHTVVSVADGSALAFATAKGASLYHDGAFAAIDDLDGYDVRHIFEDTDGCLWFSTSRGVMLYNPRHDIATLLDSSRGLIDNDTRWITRFNGELLIATRSGIVIYNERQQGSSAAFKSFDNEPTTTLFVDRDGFLWSGTESGQVKKFLAVRGHIISTIYSGEAYALTANRIASIAEDKEGNVWIASDKGVVRHRPVRLAPAAQVSMRLGGQTEMPFDAVNREVPNGRQRLTFRLTGVSLSGQVRYLYRLNAAVGEADWEFLPAQQASEREVSLFEVSEGAHTFEVIALNRDLYGASIPAATLPFRVSSPFWKRWWFYTLALAVVGITATILFVARRRHQREYVLPKELREFQPIERNPYIVGNPIRTEKMFYGREDDFRYVRTKLEGASQGVVIVFCGDRRVGKSSILYQLVNGRLGDRFVPVFVDMQEMVITSDAEFFARITRLMVESLNRKDVELTAPNFNGQNPYLIFGDFLDEVLRAIQDRVVLILLDEYELMESKVDEGKLSADFFTYLAGLMDNKERLAFIFTGSRRLEERDKKYWRELLRRSLFRKVSFLTKNDTLRLVTEPVENRVVYGRGVLDAICRLTAGQPFYTQVTCQNIIDYLNEHEQNWLTLADLENVTADIVDNPLPQMIYTWEALSDDEKLALSLLAEFLPDGESYATAFDLRNSVRLNDYPVNLSEATIRLTLEEMFHRELLDKNAGDGFRIKIDLLRLWIRRSHSIWKVVKEVRTL